MTLSQFLYLAGFVCLFFPPFTLPALVVLLVLLLLNWHPSDNPFRRPERKP